jgi:hypothetical protein
MAIPKGRWGRKVAVGAAAVAGLVAVAGPAFAATSASGTENLTLSAGTLSVSNVQPGTLSGTVAGTATGTLPSAQFSDTTGSGDGWNGTLALSTFDYTGSWVAGTNSSTGAASSALASTSAGTYTGSHDGDTYYVKVTSVSSTTVDASWYSTYNSTGGTITATEGTATAVGTNGITIDFGTSTAAGDNYSVHVGVQPASAVSLDTSASGAGVTAATGTTSPDPTLVNNGTTITAGGVGTLGTAVPVVEAAVDTGMGTYTVVPGAQAVTDAASWAATYVANAEYTIVTGP